MTNSIENLIRSRQRSGVRDGLALPHFRTTQLDHQNRLILFQGLLGHGHELLRPAHAFDHQSDDFSVGVIDEKRQIIDQIEADFVATGYGIAKTNAALRRSLYPVAQRTPTLKDQT